VKKHAIYLAGAIALIAALPVHADGPYIQAEVGQGSVDTDIGDGTTVAILDDSTTAYRLALGYELGQYFSVEGAYVDFGNINANLLIGDVTASADGFGLAAIGRLPLGDSFALTARVGYLSWDADVTLAGQGDSDSGSDIVFGIGGELNVGERLGFTAGWSRYSLDDIDLDYLSVGIRFRFGQ